MATFGISVPDEIKEDLDRVAESWYTDRSKALVRIIQEWKQRQPHLTIVPNELNPTQFDEAA